MYQDKRTTEYRISRTVLRDAYRVTLVSLFIAGICGAAGSYLKPSEPINPFLSHSYGVSKVYAAEPIKNPQTIDYDKVVSIIGELESNSGRNKAGLAGICESQGKSNVYGYGGMRLKICFDTHELAKARVKRWVVKHYSRFNNDLGKTLCYYNLGLEQSSCTYYKNYLKLGGK